MHFRNIHPRIELLRHAHIFIQVGAKHGGTENYDDDSVVSSSQKRKPDAVAAALSHLLVKMTSLQTLRVEIAIGKQDLLRQFKQLFKSDDIKIFCPGYEECKAMKAIEVVHNTKGR